MLELFVWLAAAGEVGKVRIDRGIPNEWLRMYVPYGYEVLKPGDQIVDAQERIAADALVGHFREPAFDQIQPTATGGDVVHHEAWTLRHPCLNLGCAMSAVIVHHQVQWSFAGKLAIDPTQKLQELL